MHLRVLFPIDMTRAAARVDGLVLLIFVSPSLSIESNFKNTKLN